MRPFMIEVAQYDAPSLLAEWRWLVPRADTPLFVSVFGDWVFGSPDGSLWALSVLEGTYDRIAEDAAEYNRLNKSQEWLERTFIAGWQPIAAGHGLDPTKDQCLGWKIHPLIGGEFDVSNLQVFEMVVYQSLMGQLHRQIRAPSEPSPQKRKSWFKRR